MSYRSAAHRFIALLLVLLACVSAAPETAIDTDRFHARFDRGALVALRDAADHALVEPTAGAAATLHLLSGDHAVKTAETVRPWDPASGAEDRYAAVDGLETATGTCTYALDAESGELIIEQSVSAGRTGLWGVEWPIGAVPLNLRLLLPVQSGLAFTATSPGSSHSFDYPCPWEAQLIIAEGDGYGFCVWAEDTEGRYKRLTLNRGVGGWRIGLITMPYAPFEEKDACASVRWHLNVYQGDWRVPAKRYRDWAEAAFKPTPVAAQQPAWVKDIRACAIMPLDLPVLEALPARLDPAQTLLYVPAWRAAGYDRNYPDYEAFLPELEPFIARAHELGYRVMLHVNYFGCDPQHPDFAQFEPYQCRSPWGTHEKDWWNWERADPPIKFAYINPAYKPWRDYLVARFAALCKRLPVNALHLDQTLWIYNEFAGPINGVSMLQGNIALHRELREALPEIALSGEGLNEATYRYEAFAQRHVWGLNHADGTFSESHLACAHPISSYLMRPYTTLYGYLGIAPPSQSQMYAAWQEAYRNYGIIPTIKPTLEELERPSPFGRQFFEEAKYLLENRVNIDLDRAWPPEVAFPFVTAKGTPVTYMKDRRLTSRSRVISQTLRGVAAVEGTGSIPGWIGYSDTGVLGLDTNTWYPVFRDARDPAAFHVTALGEGYAIESAKLDPDLGFVRVRLGGNAQIRLAALFDTAVCASHPANGEGAEMTGGLQAPDGGQFIVEGDVLCAHPPYKTPGNGTVSATIPVTLPHSSTLFVADVFLDPQAVGEGKSDGVIFQVRASQGKRVLSAGTFNNTAEPRALRLGLGDLAGRNINIELIVTPGRNNDCTYDWARWRNPRIECDSSRASEFGLANFAPWRLAIAGKRVLTLPEGNAETRLDVTFPGTIYLLPRIPERATLPCPLQERTFKPVFLDDSGAVLDAPPNATATVTPGAVGGVEKPGFFAHPPDHGRTVLLFPMTLPVEPATLRVQAGLRDGAKSKGAIFTLEANGVELARAKVEPGAWQELEGDLAPFAAKPAVIALITDSDGANVCDWAHWGEPRIEKKEAETPPAPAKPPETRK